MAETQVVLGIDIGGSGIKGAPINIASGDPVAERYRIDTPSPATPEAILDAIAEMVNHFDWKGKPIGCGFPGVVKFDKIYTAANLDKSWIGCNLAELIKKKTGSPAAILNDADAAGLAEALLGAGKGFAEGTVLIITLGTGIGSALVANGYPVANTEFGHCRGKNGEIWESYASAAVRKRDDLKWPEWGERVNEFLQDMCRIVSPDLIIIGGGASKKFDKFQDKIKVEAKVVPAELLNMAGIIGAALYSARTTA